MTTHKPDDDHKKPATPAPAPAPHDKPKSGAEADPFATPPVSPMPNPESAPGGDKVG